ncbi:SGNH/GDSL hydrolase family protein [Microcoleus sp. PH2017_05_CCC_O_A]|uniref:SGNH/GDSL hydrolase family protein n=1 Tax=Microcoleus sp. PH2017_05_CCC_O_A TaxID=2798816 RepID=UPI0025F937B8|nr:SGNH/GDSL hydrolase family protein [Microcoleus sp. PH2017_05_CCC_O_A]
MKARYWMPGCAIASLSAIELALRLLGFGNPALLQADAEVGYIFAPNQLVYRFGNRLQYNQFSQRSEQIDSAKPEGTIRILMTGDSVLNGNNSTDQAETITELLAARLLGIKKQVQVLNASAGSWGIGNQLGYIRKFGTFESDAVILQIGTHDLLQPSSTSAGLKNNPLMPNRQPLLAIQEVFDRYVMPRFSSVFVPNSPVGGVPVPETQRFRENMQRFEQIVALVRESNIPLFVLYTCDRSDLLPVPNQPRFKSQFVDRLKALKIPLIDTHAAWSKLPKTTVESYFRDGVHPTAPAYESIADLLFQQLCTEKKLAACSLTNTNSEK